MDGRSGRVLILEDDEERCYWFRQQLSAREHDVTCVIPQAIEWLETHDYDTILLDHDLTEEHYSSDAHDDEATGYAIASWLAAHPESQPNATIVIHSLNYIGAKRMLEVLRKAGRVAEHMPFPYLQAGLLIK
ncbi:MAG: Cyclic-phosphate processing Receiver domain [Blastocatellia bacterium]|jgi:CheY-like chemotaxis protein|nr:Cyclic-phosphate processing Receiver domain [Blastocatellia bacterium]